MKRSLRLCLLCALMVAALCVGAFAITAGEDHLATESGLYLVGDATLPSGLTVWKDDTQLNGEAAFLLTDGSVSTVTAAGAQSITFFEGATHLKYSVSIAADTQYLIVLLLGDKVPTESTIEYINQDGGGESGKTANFTLYPNGFSEGTYYVRYATSGAITDLAEIRSFLAYMLGDAFKDGTIDVSDLLVLVDHIVGSTLLSGNQFHAGDVNKDGTIDVSDLLMVVDHIVLGHFN